jgi:predicted metalloprotease with PDZ domain
LNDLATRHFDNKRARATNDEIRRGFYSDDALAIVPYTRGALYAAELDAALRAASGGKRTLDDVLRELYRDAVAKPGGLAANAVRRAIEAELGSSGVARYDAVIVRGDHPRPPSGAYGPCFAQQPRTHDAHQQVASPRDGFIWVRVSDVPDARCRAW